jgi:hypothetical protein
MLRVLPLTSEFERTRRDRFAFAVWRCCTVSNSPAHDRKFQARHVCNFGIHKNVSLRFG